MFKETITYKDYNDTERTEDVYFNFTKSEAIKMENSIEGGLSEKIKRIVDSKNTPELMNLYETILLTAYGIKSDDGRRFIKSEEISKQFKESPLYDEIFVRLLTEEGYAEKFIEGITPKA